MPETKLALIISESRSGSTLLSKQINDNLLGVMVPPEIRLDLLMRKSNAWLKSSSIEKIHRLLVCKRSLDHLNLNENELTRLIKDAKTNGNIGTLVMAILSAWADKESNKNQEIKFLVVKKGVTHLKIWQQVLAHCPHTVLVFLIRDPRAVVNSKLNASRVYHPFETLGWSGSALLALRWSWHIRKTQQAARKMPCTTVRYEDLIAEQSSVLNQLAEFFNVEVGDSENTYIVPEQERKIHKLVDSGEFREDRITGWRKELSINDQKTIELIANSSMQAFGYDCIHDLNPLEKVGLALRAIINSVKNLVVHYFNHAIAALKQHDADQQR